MTPVFPKVHDRCAVVDIHMVSFIDEIDTTDLECVCYINPLLDKGWSNILRCSILFLILRFQGLFLHYILRYIQGKVFMTPVFPEVYDRCCLCVC